MKFDELIIILKRLNIIPNINHIISLLVTESLDKASKFVYIEVPINIKQNIVIKSLILNLDIILSNKEISLL